MYLMVCTATPGLDVLDLVVTVVVVTGMFSLYFQSQFSKIKMFLNLKDHNFIIDKEVSFVFGFLFFVLFFVSKTKKYP